LSKPFCKKLCTNLAFRIRPPVLTPVLCFAISH
jgi:hypothetical protein